MKVVRWSKKTDELVQHVAGQCRPALKSELGRWLESSSRFAAFVTLYRDKIRKKLSTVDEERRQDVRAELLLACLVLADGRFELAFEAHGAQRLGPDYTVTYRTNQRFNVEVTRLRASSGVSLEKLANVIAGKLRQMPVELPNALVLVTSGVSVEAESLAAAVRLLKLASDRKEDAFFVRHGLKGAAEFYARYARLSGIFMLNEAAPPPRTLYFLNREARHPLPTEAAAAVTACLAVAAHGPQSASAQS